MAIQSRFGKLRLNDREDFGMWMWLLVFAQFVLAAAMVLSISWWPIPWKVLALGLPGILLAFAAWFQMGWKRLRIHPSASSQPRLIMDGPYRIVRHPMYTGLLWFTAAMILPAPDAWRIGCWGILLVVLWVKSRYEEQSLTARFNGYAKYRERVGRLLPKFFG